MRLSESERRTITGILEAAAARDGRPEVTAELIREVGAAASLDTPEERLTLHTNLTLTVSEAYNHGVYRMGESLIEHLGLGESVDTVEGEVSE